MQQENSYPRISIVFVLFNSCYVFFFRCVKFPFLFSKPIAASRYYEVEVNGTIFFTNQILMVVYL